MRVILRGSRARRSADHPDVRLGLSSNITVRNNTRLSLLLTDACMQMQLIRNRKFRLISESKSSLVQTCSNDKSAGMALSFRFKRWQVAPDECTIVYSFLEESWRHWSLSVNELMKYWMAAIRGPIRRESIVWKFGSMKREEFCVSGEEKGG